MKKVIAEFTVISGKKDELIEKAQELIEKSRMEAGNISYNLYYTANSNKMAFIEEWVDEKALEIHANSEHFQRIVPILRELQEEAPTLKIFNPVEYYNKNNMLFKRRSIRHFHKDRKVEKEKIDAIIHAGMQAPSAHNNQPWEFLVLDDENTINSIVPIDKHFALAAKAPIVIITLADREKGYIGGVNNAEWYPLDLSAATQNILLEATELGLGSVWIGCYPDTARIEGLQKLFNLPEHIIPFSVIAIGYSDKANYYENRLQQNKVHYNKYNI